MINLSNYNISGNPHAYVLESTLYKYRNSSPTGSHVSKGVSEIKFKSKSKALKPQKLKKLEKLKKPKKLKKQKLNPNLDPFLPQFAFARSFEEARVNKVLQRVKPTTKGAKKVVVSSLKLKEDFPSLYNYKDKQKKEKKEKSKEKQKGNTQVFELKQKNPVSKLKQNNLVSKLKQNNSVFKLKQNNSVSKLKQNNSVSKLKQNNLVSKAAKGKTNVLAKEKRDVVAKGKRKTNIAANGFLCKESGKWKSTRQEPSLVRFGLVKSSLVKPVLPGLVKSGLVKSKEPDLVRSSLVESSLVKSKEPGLVRSSLGKSKEPGLVRSSLVESSLEKSKEPGLVRSSLVESSLGKPSFAGFSFVKSRPLLCWHSDIAFLNLRHWFLNLLRAMHLVWTIAKNNGRVMLVNHGTSFDYQAHLRMVDLLIPCQLRPTLRREPYSYRRNIDNKLLKEAWEKFGQILSIKKAPLPLDLTKLTKLLKRALLGNRRPLRQKGQNEGFQLKGASKYFINQWTQLKTRLWIKLHQLSSRLMTCTYGSVKMGWFSNHFASNHVWNPFYFGPTLVGMLTGIKSKHNLRHKHRIKGTHKKKSIIGFIRSIKPGFTDAYIKSKKPLLLKISTRWFRPSPRFKRYKLPPFAPLKLSGAKEKVSPTVFTQPLLSGQKPVESGSITLPLASASPRAKALASASPGAKAKGQPFISRGRWNKEGKDTYVKFTDWKSLVEQKVIGSYSKIDTNMAAQLYIPRFYKHNPNQETKGYLSLSSFSKGQKPQLNLSSIKPIRNRSFFWPYCLDIHNHHNQGFSSLSNTKDMISFSYGYKKLLNNWKSKNNELLAKHLVLGQTNVIVFSHPERSAQLVQQARNLNIPTIGLCGGFASRNIQLEKTKSMCRRWVDFPIIANPSNHELVRMLFSKIIKNCALQQTDYT
jgi:hypothetical protein